MHSRSVSMAVALVLPLLAGGCSDGEHGFMGPMGPDDTGAGFGAATFMVVAPQGGASGVSLATGIHLQFGAGMALGMEQYVDLHLGGLDGPTVPMSCVWSGDRTSLTCTPGEPLRSGATYWIHVGGGMTATAGQRVDFDAYGPMYGGGWVVGSMMGGRHAGQPWAAMGPAWQHANGSYGMFFSFTTD